MKGPLRVLGTVAIAAVTAVAPAAAKTSHLMSTSPTGASNKVQTADARWVRAWASLAELERSRVGSPRYRELFDELSSLSSTEEREARKVHDRESAFRARVLRGHLARISNTPVRFLAEPPIVLSFSPGEAWLAARVLLPGSLRSRATAEALAEADAADLALRQAWARDVVRDDMRAFRIDGLERIARTLDQVAPTAENASLLAEVLVLLGKEEAAEQVLSKRLTGAAAHDRVELLYHRGRARLAAGKLNDAERWLGAAVAGGSLPAMLTLGEIALRASASARASAVFASIIEGGAPMRGAEQATAFRGWGTALLGATAPSSSQEEGSGRPSSTPSSPSTK